MTRCSAYVGTPDLLPAPGAPDGFYALDLSSWARGLYEGARAKGAPVDDPENAVVLQGVLRRLIDGVLVARRPAFLAVAGDVVGVPSARTAIWAEYKAGRTPPGPGYARQVATLCEILAAHRIPVFQAAGFEADDFLGALTARARRAGLRTVIMSKDHDLWQCLDPASERAVVAWDLVDDKAYAAPDVAEVYGVHADRLVDLMALAGDGDEAPGIKGIGTKKAARLINRHGTLERTLARWQWESGKLAEWLRDGAAAARMSRELVALDLRAPVFVSLGQLATGWSEADADAIRRLAVEHGLPILLDARGLPKAVVDPVLDDAWLAAGAEIEAAAARRGPGLRFDPPTRKRRSVMASVDERAIDIGRRYALVRPEGLAVDRVDVLRLISFMRRLVTLGGERMSPMPPEGWLLGRWTVPAPAPVVELFPGRTPPAPDPPPRRRA